MTIFQGRILLATDGSPHAEAAARTASELAQSTGVKLHVVAVGRSFPSGVYESYTETETGRKDLRQEAQDILDEQVRKIEEEGGRVAIAHLKMGERRDEAIVHLAEEIGAGLIVIGSRGSAGSGALMGSVADSVVRHAHCPVSGRETALRPPITALWQEQAWAMPGNTHHPAFTRPRGPARPAALGVPPATFPRRPRPISLS